MADESLEPADRIIGKMPAIPPQEWPLLVVVRYRQALDKHDGNADGIIPNKTMQQYRKKPVVIHAQKYEGKLSDLNPELLPHITREGPDGSCFVRTLEGELECKPGDWLIRGVKHEVYPCRDDIFRMTYDPV